jgi:PAS domain S-box-containing protein
MNEEHDLNDARAMRLRAEQILKETKGDIANQISKETDLQKLLHELQVHQIELEMQNEELVKANERAEDALKRYTMLYDMAPMGYLTLDQDGTIQELNFTAAEFLGLRRFSLINKNFKLFVSDQTRTEFSDFLSSVFMGNTKESCEVELGDDDQNLRYLYIEGIATEEKHQCLLSMIDISRFRSGRSNQ